MNSGRKKMFIGLQFLEFESIYGLACGWTSIQLHFYLNGKS